MVFRHVRIATSQNGAAGHVRIILEGVCRTRLGTDFAASRNRVATSLSFWPESPSGAAVHVMPDNAEPGGDAIIVYAARDGY